MSARYPFNEKKIPMTQTAVTPTVTATTDTDTTDTDTTMRSRSVAMNLINEALSRARMRSPQNINSEARRPARSIAIAARHQQARELGNLSLYGIR
jgi:hypothetical protein